MFWNESGELLCIATEESFFILKYSSDAVEKARESPDNITEDGIEDAFEVRSLTRANLEHIYYNIVVVLWLVHVTL